MEKVGVVLDGGIFLLYLKTRLVNSGSKGQERPDSIR